MEKKIGYYSFVVGSIIALILGLAASQLGELKVWLVSLLVVLGLIVGFLNITGKETKDYMMTALVLVLVAKFGGIDILGQVHTIGPYLVGVFESLIAFIVPALVVVGLRAILKISKI
tara:strand:- start:14697 stop:15047 length:351 start_codon:yes stop_codon:yes gene_type:complete